MRKQFIAKLLVLCMVLSMLPAAVFAAATVAYVPKSLSANYGSTDAAYEVNSDVNLKGYKLSAKTLTINGIYTISSDTGTGTLSIPSNGYIKLNSGAQLTLTNVALGSVYIIGADTTPSTPNVIITGTSSGSVKAGYGVYAIARDTTNIAFNAVNGGKTGNSTVKDGGGGGGGGSTTTTTTTTTTTPAAGETAVAATTSKAADGSASGTVTTAAVNTAIADSNKNNTAVIAIKATVEAEVGKPTTIAAPAAALSAIASANKSVSIGTSAGAAKLSPAAAKAIAALAGSGNVAVAVTKNADNTVTISITAGGKAVEGVSGLKASLPVPASATNSTVIKLVAADGTETIIKKSALDGNGNIDALIKSGTVTVKVEDNKKTFTDTTSHWGSSFVDFATSRELFAGTGNGTFSPNMSMNRAMLVTVLYNLEDAKSDAGAAFGDVASDAYYAAPVDWAVKAGITSGSGNGFSPDASITRQDLATMLYNYAKNIGMDTTASGSTSTFTDAGSVAGYASTAMQWAVGHGIIAGSNNQLMPTGQATRAEVATMLMRLVENM